MRLSSSFCCFFPFSRILSACSSQVKPLWYGCAKQRRQESFLHRLHFSRGSSPSPSATRMGQFGVGQAQRSAAEEIACSKLRASKRSMSSGGSNFLRSRSARGMQHTGQVTLAAPTARRASACRSTHCAQYQPCPHTSRTARQAGTSLQQMLQASAWLLITMARGLEHGVRTLPGGRNGLRKWALMKAWGSSGSCCWGGSAEHGVAGGRLVGTAANATASAASFTASSTHCRFWSADVDAESSELSGRFPSVFKLAVISRHRYAAACHHSLASRGSIGSPVTVPSLGTADCGDASSWQAEDEGGNSGEDDIPATVLPAGDPETALDSKSLATGASAMVLPCGDPRNPLDSQSGAAWISAMLLSAGDPTTALGNEPFAQLTAGTNVGATEAPSATFRRARNLLAGPAARAVALAAGGLIPGVSAASALAVALLLVALQSRAALPLLSPWDESHAMASSNVLQHRSASVIRSSSKPCSNNATAIPKLVGDAMSTNCRSLHPGPCSMQYGNP
mmetsp:Transcript_114888/g.320020  ORF Transcript_114888/g.320020 Transcript_114888/m.320020 type:complete len:509 (+) Transcript_114888:119-1645(+)